VYAAVDGGAFADQIVTFDVAGNHIGAFPAGPSPFDVLKKGGVLFVGDGVTDDIARFAPDGTPLAGFHQSDGVSDVDFPQQLAPLDSSGGYILLVAGFSAPIGVYAYDPLGLAVGYAAVGGGNRGVYELANGRIMFTDGEGVHSYDPANNNAVATLLDGPDAQFINLLVVEEPECYADCEADGDLDIDDFVCFQTMFAVNDDAADCENDGDLDIDDFICFQTLFAVGCP
jgi:hypothetical protein